MKAHSEQKREFEKARGYFKYAHRLKPDDVEVTGKLEKYHFTSRHKLFGFM